eukprot:GHVN01077098.1.p1 GENE.GHVN01077098.1~~GHVN01077098.1.p1  ORF type:complete len:134 (+),score=8.59 GHVN01077098.1:361-762(+)
MGRHQHSRVGTIISQSSLTSSAKAPEKRMITSGVTIVTPAPNPIFPLISRPYSAELYRLSPRPTMVHTRCEVHISVPSLFLESMWSANGNLGWGFFENWHPPICDAVGEKWNVGEKCAITFTWWHKAAVFDTT